jgi:hypothetical protein
LVAALLPVVLGAAGPAQIVDGPPERFSASAVHIPDIGPMQTGFIDIVLTRWSAEFERQRLLDTLFERGSSAFVDELREMPAVGYIRRPGFLGQPLRLAQVSVGEDGGRRITLLADRWIGMWETWYRPRSIDYPVTWIELDLDREGQGDGRMFIAARVTGSRQGNLMVLENFATQAVRLSNVRREKITTS